MTPNLVKEGGVVAERRKPILGLGRVISDLKLDIEGLKMTNSLKLLEMQLCDLTERARGLKDCPYKSGAFPQLMEFVARAFEPPNNPADYSPEIIDYLARTVVRSANTSDMTPAYVSAEVYELQELAKSHGIEIKADYI